MSSALLDRAIMLAEEGEAMEMSPMDADADHPTILGEKEDLGADPEDLGGEWGPELLDIEPVVKKDVPKYSVASSTVELYFDPANPKKLPNYPFRSKLETTYGEVRTRSSRHISLLPPLHNLLSGCFVSLLPPPRLSPPLLWRCHQFFVSAVCPDLSDWQIAEQEKTETARCFEMRTSMTNAMDARDALQLELEKEVQSEKISVDFIAEENEILVIKGKELDEELKDMQLKNSKLLNAQTIMASNRNEFIDRVEEHAKKIEAEEEQRQLDEIAAADAAGNEENAPVEDISNDPAMKEAQLEEVQTEIDETTSEMMMLPGNLRGPFAKILDNLKIKKLKIELIGLEDENEIQAIKSEIARFQMRELEKKAKFMDVYERVEMEVEWEALRVIADPEYYDNLPEQIETSQGVNVKFTDDGGRDFEADFRVSIDVTFETLVYDTMVYLNLDMKDEVCSVLLLHACAIILFAADSGLFADGLH